MKDGIMDVQCAEIRDQQREAWNEFSPKWKKMDALVLDSLKLVSDEIIKALNLKEDASVLDVATGTGEPGLSIAQMFPGAKVMITDISKGMMQIAEEKAAKRNIVNIETRISDVCELPFYDNSFDGVCCRFGFMFFPDMQLAAQEMARVLKPGGRMAASFWNIPEKNFWITAMMDAVNRNLNLPPPNASTPNMFRCSKAGFMNELFAEAGIKNIVEKELNGKMNCVTTDIYWHLMNNITVPLVASLSHADEFIKEKIKKEVYFTVNQKCLDGDISLDSSAVVIYGEK